MNKSLLSFILLLIGHLSFSQYCTPTYSTVCNSSYTNDLINNFYTTGGIQDISNLNTGCNFQPNNYINTGLTLITEPGAVIQTNVQCGATYQQGFAIWIDWNQDFDFDDAGEKVYESPSSGFQVFTGSFTVPSDLECGDYRMRVRSKYASAGSNILPCNNQTYGEVEDYTITVNNCEPTICEGETHTFDISNGLPTNVTSYSWSPATNISDPNGGPTVDVWPTDTTVYTVTLTSPDSTWTQSYPINVVHVPTPDAGLNDSLCHSTTVGYALSGTISNVINSHYWEYAQGPSNYPLANAVFQPNNQSLTPNTITNYPGEYTFVLHEEDDNGVCPDGTDTVLIYYSKETHTTTFVDPACYGEASGEIHITSTGEIPAVSYSIDGGTTFQASPDFTALTAGTGTSTTYNVVSENSIGCQATSTVTLTNPAQVLITAGPSPDTTICIGGELTTYASASNYGSTFDYHWEHTTDLSASQTLNPISDTTISVYAVNEFGCHSDTIEVGAILYDPITLTITDFDTVCPGFDSYHQVLAQGGYNGYSYSWTANGVVLSEITDEVFVNPNIETEYCVTVTDGCETPAETICSSVIMREVPVPYFIADTTEGCAPSTIELYNATTYELSETQTDSIRWYIDNTAYYQEDTVSHEFFDPGFYNVALKIYTNYGCSNETLINDYIVVHEQPVANFYAISNPTTIFDTEVEMVNISSGENNSYVWNFEGATPSVSGNDEPTVLYPEGVPGEYDVTLYVTNQYNCTDSITKVVQVISDVLIYAPNAFTPDGDQLNNEWRIYMDGINPLDFHLILYNRWGEIIWESYDPEGSWDGNYGGIPAQDGTYVWRIVTKDANSDKKYEFRGTVTLLR